MGYILTSWLLTVTLLCLVSSSQGQSGQTLTQKQCDQIRQEKTLLLSQYNGPNPAGFLSDILPRLVEFTLPAECSRAKPVFLQSPFNPGSTQEQGGPLGMVGDASGTIYTNGEKTRPKRMATEGSNAVSGEENLSSENMSREKRFLGGSTFGSPFGRGRGKKEVSEADQMMKSLLFYTKMQSRLMKQRYRRPDPHSQSYYGERITFGDGFYGDQFPGRKKREATANEASASKDEESSPLLRKKRFLFPPGEPGDAPAGGMNPLGQMMSLLMGTAVDPNTGKRMEFGGDGMKRMMRSSFMNMMPASMRAPPGKEPSDFVKNMAPLWYFGRMQRFMNPPPMPRYKIKDPGDYPHLYGRTSRRVMNRNKDGFYGDVLPGRRRMKRSAEASSVEVASVESDDVLSRSKRQSESSNNDVITFGDISIPVDFFKPRDRNDDLYPEKRNNYHAPPQHTHYNTYNSYYRPPPPSARTYTPRYTAQQRRQDQIKRQQWVQRQNSLRQYYWQQYYQQQRFQRQQQPNYVYPPQQYQQYQPTPPTPPRHLQPGPQYTPPAAYPPQTPPVQNLPVAPTQPRQAPPPVNHTPPRAHPAVQAPPPQAPPHQAPPHQTPLHQTPPYHAPPHHAPPPNNMDNVFYLPPHNAAPPAPTAPQNPQDPFIYSPHGRKKRESGDDKRKNQAQNTLLNFFNSPFVQPLYNPTSSFFNPFHSSPLGSSPFTSPSYNPFNLFTNPRSLSSKQAYHAGAGRGLVYGDRLPWASGPLSQPVASARSRLPAPSRAALPPQLPPAGISPAGIDPFVTGIPPTGFDPLFPEIPPVNAAGAPLLPPGGASPMNPAGAPLSSLAGPPLAGGSPFLTPVGTALPNQNPYAATRQHSW